MDDESIRRASSPAPGTTRAQERFLEQRRASGLAGAEALATFVEPPGMETRGIDKVAGAF